MVIEPEAAAAEPDGKDGTASLPPFTWTEGREEAAVLCAEDELTDQEISDKLGICRKTLTLWKQRQEFRDRIAEHSRRFGRAVLRHAIAKPGRRVKALNDRWQRMQAIIEARAREYEDATIPGGSTGLIVRQVKSVRSGDSFETVEEYAVDTALLKILLDTERQAAQECGQWLEKRDITSGGEPLTLVLGVPDEVI